MLYNPRQNFENINTEIQVKKKSTTATASKHKMSAIEYDPMEVELDRLFDQFIRSLGTIRRGRRRGGQRKRFPSIDLHEQNNEYVVTAELPVSNEKAVVTQRCSQMLSSLKYCRVLTKKI